MRKKPQDAQFAHSEHRLGRFGLILIWSILIIMARFNVHGTRNITSAYVRIPLALALN